MELINFIINTLITVIISYFASEKFNKINETRRKKALKLIIKSQLESDYKNIKHMIRISEEAISQNPTIIYTNPHLYLSDIKVLLGAGWWENVELEVAQFFPDNYHSISKHFKKIKTIRTDTSIKEYLESTLYDLYDLKEEIIKLIDDFKK